MRNVYEFGPFRLDTRQGILLREGERVALVPKAVDLLAVLVAAAGDVVAKRQLLETVWPGIVVEEGNLSKLVFLLRQNLERHLPGAIETVPKRGYRFAARVRSPGEAAAEPLARADARVAAVAVLPFADLSAEKNQHHLCEGISEEILNALAHTPGLAVVARTSSFRFGPDPADVKEIGRQLGVASLVEGSVRTSADRLRVTANLLDTDTGFQRWSESFDRPLADVFAIQDEIAGAVAHRIVETIPGPRAARRAADFAAYDLYLQGRYLWNRRPGDVVWRALDCFRRAVEKDPGFALAWAGMADVYATLGSWEAGVLPHAEAQAEAKAHAVRALAIDPALAEAQTTLAYTALHYDRDVAAAEAGFQRALAIQPGYANAHHWYAHALTAAGRFAESLAASRRALATDPVNVLLQVHLAWHHHMAREPQAVVEQAERVVHQDPAYHWGHYFLAWGAEALGGVTRAVDAYRRAVRCADGNPVMRAGLGRGLALAGDAGEALAIADELARWGGEHDLYAYEIAVIHLGRSDRAQALAWLERAHARHSGWMVYIGVDPRLDPLRGDARFEALRRPPAR